MPQPKRLPTKSAKRGVGINLYQAQRVQLLTKKPQVTVPSARTRYFNPERTEMFGAPPVEMLEGKLPKDQGWGFGKKAPMPFGGQKLGLTPKGKKFKF